MSAELYTEFVGRLTSFVYAPQTKTTKGMLTVYFKASNSSKKNVRMQIPGPNDQKCVAPFGVTSYEGNENTTRKSLSLSLKEPALISFFDEWDKHNVDMALQNPSWFKKKMTKEMISTIYQPMVARDDSSKGYPPRLRTKIDTEGKRKLNVIVMNDDESVNWRKGDISDIVKFSEVMVILEASSLWFQSKMFGMTLLVTDVIIFPKFERIEFPFNVGSNKIPVKQSEMSEMSEVSAESKVSEKFELNSNSLLFQNKGHVSLVGVTEDDEAFHQHKKVRTN